MKSKLFRVCNFVQVYSHMSNNNKRTDNIIIIKSKIKNNETMRLTTNRKNGGKRFTTKVMFCVFCFTNENGF